MKKIKHLANTRGHANHGWLNAHHSFSFASWHNPDRIHFGALRVLNDDIVAPKMGFSTHPHDNMEIITIPLSGSLSHKDSMGNGSTIRTGEVQVMSAGTGIEHSEFNSEKDKPLNLFQIWIFPNKRNVQPRYDQITYNLDAMRDQFLQVVSPDSNDVGTWIHQDAWIHLAELSSLKSLIYTMKKPGNGVYFMIIEGEAQIGDENLNKKDALGVWETNEIILTTTNGAKIIAIEVPMQF